VQESSESVGGWLFDT